MSMTRGNGSRAGSPGARVQFLGCPLDPIDMGEAVERCLALIEKPGTAMQVSINAAKLVACDRDPGLASFIAEADLVNADGQAVVWGARLLGHAVPERVAGIDLMHQLIAAAEQLELGVYIVGGREPVLEAALARISSLHPMVRIAGAEHGYYSDGEQDEVVERINSSGAAILFLAMSSPRKEDFLARNRDLLNVSLAMGVGGAIDVLAGETRRAPLWMQRAGVEWLYRVIQEPRRMWRRYLIGNLRFIRLVLAELLRNAAKAVRLRRRS